MHHIAAGDASLLFADRFEPHHLKCLQNCGIMRMTTTLGGLYETFIDNYNDTCDDYRIMFM